MSPLRWDLLPHALALVQGALQCSEAEAFVSIKALIADGQVEARGPWPREGLNGNPRPNGHAHTLPSESFRFAELTRDGAGVVFLDRLGVPIPWVEIDMDQLRRALAQEASPPAMSAAAPVRKSKKAKQPLRPKGNPGTKTKRIIAAMREMDPTELHDMTLKELSNQFDVAQSTCKKARDTALE
jgi:hypothetical protein